MKSLQNNKGILAAVIIFIFAIVMYNMFFKSSAPAVTADTQTVGSDLVTIFNNLKLVTLNQDLFEAPTYRKLTDFSTAVPLQPVGRNNPFDLIGR